MTIVIASAPGKAIVSGEYVVLLGAPAISAAIDRRIHVVLEPGDCEYHSVRSPGLFDDAEFFIDTGNGALQWRDPNAAQRFKLFECVWHRCAPAVEGSLDIKIDSRSCFDENTGSKIGLGSSAAIASALTMAFSKLAKGTNDTTALAYAAHQDFQNNTGSGVDVATSLSGGVIEFVNDGQPAIRRLDPVDDLQLQFFWSGKASGTISQIGKFIGGSNSGHSNLRTTGLTDHAARAAKAWHSGSAVKILAAMTDYVAALVEFSDEHRLDIFAAGHDRMSALATDCGIVYKPCGAGGGDIGVAMATDEAQLQKFGERAEPLNFKALDCKIDWCGTAAESTP